MSSTTKSLLYSQLKAMGNTEYTWQDIFRMSKTELANLESEMNNKVEAENKRAHKEKSSELFKEIRAKKINKFYKDINREVNIQDLETAIVKLDLFGINEFEHVIKVINNPPTKLNPTIKSQLGAAEFHYNTSPFYKYSDYKKYYEDEYCLISYPNIIFHILSDATVNQIFEETRDKNVKIDVKVILNTVEIIDITEEMIMKTLTLNRTVFSVVSNPIPYSFSSMLSIKQAEKPKKLVDFEHMPLFNQGITRQKIKDRMDLYFTQFGKHILDRLGTSGATIYKFISYSLLVAQVNNIDGQKYFVDKALVGKKSIINVHNEDNKCFLYSLAAFMKFKENSNYDHKERPAQYEPYFSKFTYSDEDFPMCVDKVEAFYKKNKEYLQSKGVNGINIFTIGEKLNYLLIMENSDKCIDLILLKSGDNTHYVLITDFNSFNLTKTTNLKNKMYKCRKCLIYSNRNKESYEKHIKICNDVCERPLVLPKSKESVDYINKKIEQENAVIKEKNEIAILEGKKPEKESKFLKYDSCELEFKSYNKMLDVPFVIYYDYESCLINTRYHKNNFVETTIELEVDLKKYTAPISIMKNTANVNKHQPNSWCCNTVCIDPKYNKFMISKTYEDGDECTKDFCEYLLEEEKRIRDIKNIVKPMEITKEQEKEFKNAKVCHICQKSLEDDRVRDHCHITGDYRGAAHSICNLNFKYKSFIPVLAHNAKNYDNHLFIKQLAKTCDKKYALSVIAQNTEKYISFSRKKLSVKLEVDDDIQQELRFLDSFSFLASSLSKLSETLKPEDFINTKKYIETLQFTTENQKEQAFKLLCKKGVYPYSFVNDVSKLNITNLPSIEQFDDKLSEGKISSDKYSYNIYKKLNEKEYAHAQEVWEFFNCKTLKDYHMLYLATDVMLLSDVFETFRKNMKSGFKLDPAHYYTICSFAWDSMLYQMKVKHDFKFELLTQDKVDILQFMQKMHRGGISMVLNRHYEEQKFEDGTQTYCNYYDCNSLYPSAMVNYLPYRGFEWIKDVSKFTTSYIMSINYDKQYEYLNCNENFKHYETEKVKLNSGDQIGYFLEVDLDIPRHLHDYFSQYPPCAEHQQISNEMLSKYQMDLKSKIHNGSTPESHDSKLCLTLTNKREYGIHYRLLQFFLHLGVRLVKVHRVTRFIEKQYAKEYIDMCVNKRKNSNNKFEKDLYKMCMNSPYGKTQENPMKRINFKLVTQKDKAIKLQSQMTWKTTIPYDETMSGILMRKSFDKMDKPFYCGVAILELSKLIMYRFWYSVLKPAFNDIKLHMTDTDSFVFSFRCKPSEYDDFMQKNLNIFDNSDLPKDSKYYNSENCKALSKFKPENGDIPIREFVGIKAKSYALAYGTHEHVKNKGIKEHITKNSNLQMYKRALLHDVAFSATQSTFKSVNHNITTSTTFDKLALFSFDDKVFHTKDDNGNHLSLPHGHYLSNSYVPTESDKYIYSLQKYEAEITRNVDLPLSIVNINSNPSKIENPTINRHSFTNPKNKMTKKITCNKTEFGCPDYMFINKVECSKDSFVFKNEKELREHLSKNWELHEVITTDKGVVPYFDFEYKMPISKIDNIEKMEYEFAKLYANVVAKYYDELQADYGDSEKYKIYGFNSSGKVLNNEYKFSFHFIVRGNIYFKNTEALKLSFDDRILNVIGFDTSAYKSKQNMRFAFSPKSDGSRKLRRFAFNNGELYYYPLDKIKSLEKFIITNTNKCRLRLEKYFKSHDKDDSDSDSEEYENMDSSENDTDSRVLTKDLTNGKKYFITEEKLESLLDNISAEEYSMWRQVLLALNNICSYNKYDFMKYAILYSKKSHKYSPSVDNVIRSTVNGKYKSNAGVGTLFHYASSV